MKKRMVLLFLVPFLLLADIALWFAYLYWLIVDEDTAWTMALAEDDLGNAGIGGKLGRTISAHAARSRRDGGTFGCVMCAFLEWADPGHCERALTDPKQNLR